MTAQLRTAPLNKFQKQSLFPIALLAMLFLGQPAIAQSTWTGGSGNWSSSAATGWSTGGVPNSIGATAQLLTLTTGTVTTQDVVGGVTIGNLIYGNGAAGAFTWTITNTNGITFNDNGTGANITNGNTTSGANALIVGAGNILLADNLTITNNATASTTTNGAVQILGTITGNGNLTLSNNAAIGSSLTSTSFAGAIRTQTGVNTFLGNVLVNKGLVTFNVATSLGSGANTVTLGATGQGSAMLVSTAAILMPNDIVVASGSEGTLTLGTLSTSTATTGHGYSGQVRLDGNLSVTSLNTSGPGVVFLGNITGTGSLTKVGVGSVSLNGFNSYTGGTTVSAGALMFNTITSVGGTGANVTVNSGGTAAATFPIDQVFLNRIASASAGVVALGASSSYDLDFSAAGANLTAASLGATGTFTYSGNLTPNANVFRLGGGFGTPVLTVSSALAGANNSLIVGNNGTIAGTVTLTGANSFGGKSTLAAGTLSVSSFNSVVGGKLTSSLGAPTSVANGTIALGSGTNAVALTYTGLGETTDRVIDLSGSTGTVTINANGSEPLVFTNSFTATGGGIKTLTLSGTNTEANTILGAIVNNSATNTTAVIKTGAGQWILAGASTYTGATTVSVGTLVVSGSLATASITVDGGTLNLTGSANSATTVAVSNGAFNLSGSVNGLSTVTIAGGTSTVASTGVLSGTVNVNAATAVLKYAANSSVGGTGRTITTTGTTVATFAIDQAFLDRFVQTSAGVVALGADSANHLDFTGFTLLSLGANGGTFTYSGTITPNSGAYFLGGGGGTLNVTSTLTGANKLTIAANGTSATSTVVLASTNNYTGATSLVGGIASISSIKNVNGGASGLGAPTTVSDGTINLGGVAAGMLLYTGAGDTTDRVINLNGTTVGGVIDSSGTGALVFTTSFTALANGNKTLSLTGSNTDANTIQGAIVNSTGTTGVSKSGLGTWVLSGTNTYTGATTTTAGILNIIGSIASLTISVTGGALNLSGSATSATTLGVTVSGGLFNLTGTLSSAAATPPTVSVNNVAGVFRITSMSNIAGTARAITSTGTTVLPFAIDQAALNRFAVASTGAVALGINSSNPLDFSAFTSTLSLGANGGSFTYSGAITPGAATYRLGGGGGTLTVTSALTGANALVVSGVGGGTVILNNANDYTGATTINSGGILQIGDVTALGGSGRSVTVTGTLATSYALDETTLARFVTTSAGFVALAANSSNALNFSAGGNNFTSTLSLGSTGDFTYSGLLTPAGTLFRLGGGGGNLTVSSQLVGAFGLTVVNGGLPSSIVTLSGSNVYTGTTTITSGTVRIMGGSAIPDGTSTGNVSIAAAGTLQLASNHDETINALTSAGVVDTHPTLVTAPITLTVGANNGTAIFSGTIRNSGAALSLVKVGTGTQTLSGVNTYTGTTTVNSGVLILSNANNILTGTMNANSGGTLQFNNVGAMPTTAGIVFANVGGMVTAGYAMDQAFLAKLNNATQGVIGLALDSGNDLDFTGFATTSFGASGSRTYSGTLTPDAATFRLGGGGSLSSISTLTISSNLGGANSLVVDVNGTLSLTSNVVLAGVNSYTGTTTVNAGALHFAKPTALYNGVVSNWNASKLIVNTGGVASFFVGGQGEFTPADIATLSAIGTTTGGFLSGSGIGFNTTNAVGGSFTYANSISNTNGGSNALGVVKYGNNKLVLTATNTYTGQTVVAAGILQFTKSAGLYNGDTALYDAAHLVIFGGTPLTSVDAPTLALNVGGTGEFTSPQIEAIAAAGSLTGGFLANASIALDTTNASGGEFVFTGNIANPGGNVLNVVKLGTNKLTLAGNYSYTGSTSVNAGVVNLTGTITGNSVIAAGTFGGNVGQIDVTTGSASATNVFVGLSGIGTMNMSGGSVTVSSFTSFARNAGSKGIFNQSGGLFQVTGDFNVGDNGRGEMLQTGGTIVAGGYVVGFNAVSSGSAIQNGASASISTTGVFFVGNLGKGDFTQNAGSINVGSFTSVARDAVSIGSYTMTGGTFNSGGDFNVADFGTATMNMSGGTLTDHGSFVIGFQPGANGNMTMTGGVIESDFWVMVGRAGKGTLVQSGGKITANILGLVGGGRAFGVGVEAGGSGNFTMTGGELIVRNDWFVTAVSGTGNSLVQGSAKITAQTLAAGQNTGSNGVITINITDPSGFIKLIDVVSNNPITGITRIGVNSGSTGTLNFIAGTITSGDQTDVGGSGKGTFNMSGGTFNGGDNIRIGLNSTGVGIMNMTGGTFHVLGNEPSFTGNLVVGSNGNGTLNMSGGTINLLVGPTGTLGPTGTNTNNAASWSVQNNQSGLPADALIRAQDANMYIGRLIGTGVANLSGGVINVGANVFIGGFNGTTGGKGTLNITGGELNVGLSSPTGGDFVLGSPIPSSVATVNLQGGLLNVTRITGIIGSGGGGTLAFNFTGGTLKFLEWNSPLAGGNLGTLVQNGPSSLLDVSTNSSLIRSDYSLGAGTATVGAGRTMTANNIINAAGAGVINVGDGTATAGNVTVTTGNIGVDTLDLRNGNVTATAVTVATRLAGVGTVNGSVTVNTGALIRGGGVTGGPNVGTVNISNGLTISNGATLAIQVADGTTPAAINTGLSTLGPASNSFLHITGGTTTFDANMLIAIDATGVSFVPTATYSYLVVDGAGNQTLNITAPGQFSFTGFANTPTSVSLAGDSAGNIYLNFTTAVPEPATVLLWCAPVLAVFAGWRRHRRIQVGESAAR